MLFSIIKMENKSHTRDGKHVASKLVLLPTRHHLFRQKPIMRSVDVSRYRLICSGKKLDDRFLHTNSNQWKQIALFLEKKEIYCTWFQPSHGDVDDQFPLLKIQEQYYNIPLRIQKHIFRHIRLSSSFVNREVTPNGLVKLRIPRALLLEKQRTARRFMVNPNLT
jgi:hypothetical protein